MFEKNIAKTAKKCIINLKGKMKGNVCMNISEIQNKILEGMALGKVVITNSPSFSRIIDHSKACFPTRITLRPSASVTIARTVLSQFDL